MSTQSDILTDSFLALRAKLHRAAMALLHDRMDADDVLQDAYVRLSQVPVASEGEARGMLFRTMRNACIDLLRDRSRFADAQDAAEGLTYPAYDETEDIRRLVMQTLSPMQRRVYDMAMLDEMEYRDIAQALGLSVEAVRMHMMRARQKLRQAYDDHYR